MKSMQGLGWLAAGVLALGLNGIYHDGGAVWARQAVGQIIERIESRTGPVLALAAGRADWFLTQAKITAAQEETASCRAATAVARFQTKMARSRTGDGQDRGDVGAGRSRYGSNRGESSAD